MRYKEIVNVENLIFAILAFSPTAQIVISFQVTKAGAQENNGSGFEVANVTIPNGAANPSLDLSLENLANWYEPRQISIAAGDKIIWKNEDTEPHTVTSGRGPGITSVQTNEKGMPDGIFDSGFFATSESWSRTFYTPGTYSYFCTIYPGWKGPSR